MKSSVRIASAAAGILALGIVPFISVAQEVPATDPAAATATTSSSESTSVAADGTVTATSESASTSVAADGTVTATTESSSTESSASSDSSSSQ
jgi:hypothetical protein